MVYELQWVSVGKKDHLVILYFHFVPPWLHKKDKEKQENQNPSDLHAQVLSVSIEGGGIDVFMRSVYRSMQVCKDMDVLM